MPSREGLHSCPFCREDVPRSARRCPRCREVLPEMEDDPPPRRLRRGIADGDPPPRRLRRPPADEVDDFDEPRPRRRRRRYEDEDDEEEFERPRRRRGPFARCPHCRCPGFADKVTFTWWGGLIGPRMLSHVTCRKCHRGYNGKTGKDNTTGIVIYTVVGFGLALLVLIVLAIANVR